MANDPLLNTSSQIPAPIFRLGGELVINRMGFGAMRLTGQPGNWGPYPDWAHGVRVLRRAIELGINFIDTADAYGPGDSEKLIADALHPYAETVVIATKGGTVKTGPGQFHADGSPEYLRKACNLSLARLRVERIDLYQLHRPDPDVPFDDSIGALAELRQAGKVRLIGLSNISLAQLQAAERIAPIASVQNRYNLRDRGDDALIDYCAQRGIAFLPYSPLGAPPFDRSAKLAASDDEALAAVARRRRLTTAQAALAWLFYRAPNIIPIPGTTSLEHLEENYAALRAHLTPEDLTDLDAEN
jgi:aryl-alcohol dehydrogenase-like predicted oxidoreductase